MRVLYVVHYPVFGGPHNIAIELNRALAAGGGQVSVLLPDEPGNAADRLRAEGLQVMTMPLSRLRKTKDLGEHATLPGRLRGDIGRIEDLLRSDGIDVVMIGGLVNPHAALAARRCAVPVVWQALDTRAPTAVRVPAYALAERLATVMMFNGRAVRELHVGSDDPPIPSFNFSSPVDTSRLRPSAEVRRITRERLGIPDDAPVVGSVANFNPQKGIEHFVGSAATVVQQHPDARFLMIGARYDTHRGYAERIDAQIAASPVSSDQFVMLDHQDRLENFYPAMDVMVIASVPNSEGMPTTSLEAMACGVPVVSTDVGAVSEAVADRITGRVVPALDDGAIGAAVAEILGDSGERDAFSSASVQRIEESFSWAAFADVHLRALEAAVADDAVQRAATLAPPGITSEPPDLRELCVCPACGGTLDWRIEAIDCSSCGATYGIDEGIPLLISGPTGSAELDGTKWVQAEFFDNEPSEFEITRPHGTPELYQWTLGEKYRRSVEGIETELRNATTLTVCGGSGLDGEYLARSGASVIVSDISVGAVKRARERAERSGLKVAAIVADCEHLPFADRSIDLVYVHDGLHHVDRPAAGVTEMIRIARKTISISEPASAGATEAAVRVGAAETEEEAGNQIHRFELDEITEPLRAAGFDVIGAGRYALYYKHEPGAITRLLSRPRLLPVTRGVINGFNSRFGRFGNKLSVRAVRSR